MSENKQLKWNDVSSHKKIIDLLRSEKVLVGDSDTVPGLLVLATATGHKRLNCIKRRSNKPYLLFVANQKKLAQFVTSETIKQLKPIIDEFWPGPLTIIMNAKKNIEPPLCTQAGTIAVRIPDHVGLQAVLAHVPALFSTSANQAGEPTSRTVDAINPEIVSMVDAVVYGKEQSRLSYSTIIDCTQKPYKIVRKGAITKERLHETITF